MKAASKSSSTRRRKAVKSSRARGSKNEIAIARRQFPRRREYLPKPPDWTALPFIVHSRSQWTEWSVPPVKDYGIACYAGREYAAHLAQYLKDTGNVGANLLGHIASSIDFADDSEAKGYWVGFFSYLERLIYFGAKSIDVFGDVDSLMARDVEIDAARKREDANG